MLICLLETTQLRQLETTLSAVSEDRYNKLVVVLIMTARIFKLVLTDLLHRFKIIILIVQLALRRLISLYILFALHYLLF